MKNCFFILFGLILLFGCRKINQAPTTIQDNLNLENTGNFIFDKYPTAIPKPVEVYFHIPVDIDKSNAPILFVFPGMNRNAEEYRNTWIARGPLPCALSASRGLGKFLGHLRRAAPRARLARHRARRPALAMLQTGRPPLRVA